MKGNFSSMQETFQADILWKTVQSGCKTMLDHNSKLALQAKKLAEAESQGDNLLIGEAALEFFYGDEEDEEKHRAKRESESTFGTGLADLFELASEVLQQEYFLHHFREEQESVAGKSRVKRQSTMGGILSENTDAFDDEELFDEDFSDDQIRYNPYIADIAYFFPLLEFYIPFDGSFIFLQEPYDIFKTETDNI